VFANGRGEVVFSKLGKFTQVITDFETIHYHSKPLACMRHLQTSSSFKRRMRTPKDGKTTSMPTRTRCGS
jgi:hypothetical protein